MKLFISIFLSLAFLVAVINVTTEKKTGKEEEVTKSETNTPVENSIEDSTELTYKKYISIKKGMTYQQVINIAGKGEELSSSDMAGYKTVVRMWKGSLGSNMILTFQNNKLIVKAQFGLK